MIKAGRRAMHPVLAAVLFCLLFTGIFVLFSVFRPTVPSRLERFAHGATGTLAGLIATAVFVRLDRTSFRAIGLRADRATFGKFLVGVLIGLGVVIMMFFCLIVFGDLNLVEQSPFSVRSFLVWTLAFIPLAFMEELAFRAYPLLVLRRRCGIWGSLLLTSLLFALYHIANGWDVLLSFLGPGIWGLVFGLAALYSKGIALPTGVHYAANLTQAAVGMSNGFTPLWRLQPQGESTTSGSNEILGIAIQVALLLVTIIAIEQYKRKTRPFSVAAE